MSEAFPMVPMSHTSFIGFSIRRILLATVFVVLTVTATSAQTASPSSPPDPLAGTLALAEGEKDGIRLGSSLKFVAKGDELMQAINRELSNPAGVLTLYLNGVRMEKTPVRRLRETDGELVLAFDLTRNAQDDASRKSWDALLALQRDWVMKLHVAVGVGKNPARLVDVTELVPVYVAKAERVYTMLAVALAILLVTFVLLVKRSRMLMDENTGLYSLGKSQMAFWGLLVVLTFASVWILTGTMERIPAQVLILLGISAATGLSAVLIGRDDQQKKAAVRQQLDQLTVERDALQARQAAGTALSATEAARLNSVASEIKALQDRIEASQPQGFFKDIISDGNGASFHRMQVVIWTLVLGGVFIDTVLQTISMPEFPEQLLVLMGISNGTYLGFKTAEK